MHFIRSEQRKRAVAYDTFIEASHHALGNVAASSVAGTFKLQLTETLDNLFLPNVRHGKVMMPKAERALSKVAFLPMLDTTESYAVDKAFLLPTPSRVERSKRQYGVDFKAFSFGDRGQKLKPFEHGVAGATSLNIIAAKKLETPFCLSSRPLITVEGRFSSRPQLAAHILLHELTHVHDMETWHIPLSNEENPTTSIERVRPTTEMHAYAVEHDLPIDTDDRMSIEDAAHFLWTAKGCRHDEMPRLSSIGTELLKGYGAF